MRQSATTPIKAVRGSKLNTAVLPWLYLHMTHSRKRCPRHLTYQRTALNASQEPTQKRTPIGEAAGSISCSAKHSTGFASGSEWGAGGRVLRKQQGRLISTQSFTPKYCCGCTIQRRMIHRDGKAETRTKARGSVFCCRFRLYELVVEHLL